MHEIGEAHGHNGNQTYGANFRLLFTKAAEKADQILRTGTRRVWFLGSVLRLRSIEELRAWVAQGINFVVIDSETGEDVTRVPLA